MNTQIWASIAVILTSAACPAWAVVINVGNPGDLDRNYANAGTTPPSFGGIDLSGVVKVQVGTALCSGSVLSDGLSILTAGHCVSTSYGNLFGTSANVSFLGPTGFVGGVASSLSVNPGWTGDVNDGFDLAVLHLDTAAPSFVARYAIFSGIPDITTSVDVIAGYGYGGTGVSGYDSVNYGFGTLRAGTNQYVVRGGHVGGPDTWLVSQIYDPSPGGSDTNILGAAIPYQSVSAAGIAPGDSGGPTFQNGLLVGVHDIIGCFSYPNDPNICNPTGHPVDSSFGEFFADTNVAEGSNYAWVMGQQQSTVAEVPEPGTCTFFTAGGCLLLLRRCVGRCRQP